MAQFNFNNDITDIVKMDGPIQRGPPMRWQRKAQETLIRVHSTDGAVSSPMKARSKTPGKNSSAPSNGGKTPKTPGGKTPGRQGLDTGVFSKSGKKPKTPGQLTPGRLQDRYIPARSSTDMEFGHYAIMKNEREDEEEEKDEEGNENSNIMAPVSNAEYKEQLMDAMEVRKSKILNFRTKAPQHPSQAGSNHQVLYSCGKSSIQKSAASRHIPKEPERVLDAPDLMDDYYLNLLDWSQANLLTVSLGNAVFLWNATNGTITQLMELTAPDEYISSVSWVQEGAIIAIGISNGTVQIWDADNQKLIRTMAGHAARVGSLSWNQHILSSGSRTGAIHQHDVRVADHQVASLTHHTQEVCGLRWSPDGRHLASGGNDNVVNIWGNQSGSGRWAQEPIHSLLDHNAAVKALAWCPWQPYLLATGGGSTDRHIRLWNVQSGAMISATDTQSQVCSLLWSKEHREIISGHGYALNHLRIWKYPTMKTVIDLVGHTSRILCMTMSPDGTTVASAAADETIRLWKCFAIEKTAKKVPTKEDKKMTSGLNMCIR